MPVPTVHRIPIQGVRFALASVPAPPATGESADASAADPLRLGPALALPWNQTVQLNWYGDTVAFAPGSVSVPNPERVPFLLDHQSHAMGYGAAFSDSPDGLMATVAIPRAELDDPTTATTVRQMGNGVRSALSVGVVIDAADETDGPERGTSHFNVTAGHLVELSSVLIPRFDDARHPPLAASALRADAPDPDDEPDDEPDAEPEPDPEENHVPATATAAADADADRTANHRRAVTAARRRSRPDRGASSPRSGSTSWRRALGTIDMGYRGVVQMALADAITGDIPGLLPEAWISDVIDIMGESSATVQAFRQVPLPDAGMTVNIPIVHQYPDVGVQAAEKTQISTRKALINPGAFPVETFAGGQDISLQAIQRSSPAYLDILMRLFVKEMAIQLETAVAASVIAGTTTSAMPISAADINGSMVDAAAHILTTTLSFPTVLVLGVNLWTAMAKAVDTAGRPLFPTLSPVNPIGTLDMTSADGNVRGLTYYVAPLMAPDKGVMGVAGAFVTMLGPVGTLTADVPAVLGRDVAVYRFAAFGMTDARGAVGLTLAATTGTTRGGKNAD